MRAHRTSVRNHEKPRALAFETRVGVISLSRTFTPMPASILLSVVAGVCCRVRRGNGNIARLPRKRTTDLRDHRSFAILSPMLREQHSDSKATDARYQSELPEETRLYDDRNPVCRYYHITRRTEVLQTLAEVSGKLPNPITFVDLGCGSGTYLRSTQAFFQTRIGVDLALHKLRFARNSAQADSSRYVTASVLDVPLGPGCVDVILCSEVLEHFPEPELVLAEVARIARPGAFVIISAPARADLIALAKSVFGSGPGNSRRLERADM